MTAPTCQFDWPYPTCGTHSGGKKADICDIGLAALRSQLDDLQAERGVLVNSARLVAHAALPFLERENESYQTHNTGEVLQAARAAIQKATPETNRLAVAWMQTMQVTLNEQARVIGLFVRAVNRLEKIMDDGLWGHALHCNFPVKPPVRTNCNCGVTDLLYARRQALSPPEPKEA